MNASSLPDTSRVGRCSVLFEGFGANDDDGDDVNPPDLLFSLVRDHNLLSYMLR